MYKCVINLHKISRKWSHYICELHGDGKLVISNVKCKVKKEKVPRFAGQTLKPKN